MTNIFRKFKKYHYDFIDNLRYMKHTIQLRLGGTFTQHILRNSLFSHGKITMISFIL